MKSNTFEISPNNEMINMHKDHNFMTTLCFDIFKKQCTLFILQLGKQPQ
jgi:hypothetical protein